MIPDDIQTLMSEESIAMVLVACLTSGEVESVRREPLQYDGLVQGLFGDRERVLALDRSLLERPTPRLWGQGAVSCVICKPNDTTIVGLFSNKQREPAELYHWSLEIEKKVAHLWVGQH